MSNRYHVIGVAGVGMSAVAELLASQGVDVSGSDRAHDQGPSPDVLNRLCARGVRMVPQTGEGITPSTTAVVVSTAIEETNPDLIRARTIGIPVVHRAQMVADLARGKRCVAVTGTAGKTTVTGMIGWILEQLGRDPTVVNGGVLLDWKREDRVGNVRVGESDLWVIEADESDRSLLAFEPEWAVITNVSKDHFEVDDVAALFAEFAGRARAGVLAGEDVVRALSPTRIDGFDGGTVQSDGRWLLELGAHRIPVPVPGRHNAENARAAVSLCMRLGCPLDDISEALATFRGIERRLELVGECEGITVIDDYGHNPAKIAAAWSTVAERAGRVLGVWRPHGFAPLALMRDELADSIASVCRPRDRLYLLPVFYAGGTATGNVTSADLAADLTHRGIDAKTMEDYPALEEAIVSACRPGDTVLVMGARDPDLPRFARRLAGRLSGSPEPHNPKRAS